MEPVNGIVKNHLKEDNPVALLFKKLGDSCQKEDSKPYQSKGKKRISV